MRVSGDVQRNKHIAICATGSNVRSRNEFSSSFYRHGFVFFGRRNCKLFFNKTLWICRVHIYVYTELFVDFLKLINIVFECFKIKGYLARESHVAALQTNRLLNLKDHM
jgi:hypothetical protein